MLNVIALRPAQKIPFQETPSRPSSSPRHHVHIEEVQKNSGRLDCGDEADDEGTPQDIYGAR
jgi:hypothetical protein